LILVLLTGRDSLTVTQAIINDRPRKIHDWRKPSEVFTELLEADASTA
jgi:transposase, IS30 family